MEHIPAHPDTGGFDIETLPPVDVPQTEWPNHPILRRARLNDLGDGLEWPEATYEQLPLLREIALVVDDGVLCARLASQFNFDRFVDSTTDDNGPAQPARHVSDRQRFYTRVTDNGFHVVGVFSAATIADRRRYFQWLTGAWVEIGLSGFLYVRDDIDTHFSEVTGTQLDETQPGATTTSMTAEEQWTAESVQSQFVGDPIVEPVAEAAPKSMFEPVIEPLTAETFPRISPPDPVTAANLLPPPPAAYEPVLGEHVAIPEQLAAPVQQESPPVTEPVAEPVAEPSAEPSAAAEQAPAPHFEAAPVFEPVTELPPAPAVPPATPAAAAPVAAQITEPIVAPSAHLAPAHAAPSTPTRNAESLQAAGIQRSIAMALATVAHRSDVDLVGAATIDHVARVAETFDPGSEAIRHCAAWLHDILERSDLTERDLLEAGIDAEIVDIVSILTRRDGVAEEAWLAAIAANPDARAVKISAVADHAAPWRLRRLDPTTRASIESAQGDLLAFLKSE